MSPMKAELIAVAICVAVFAITFGGYLLLSGGKGQHKGDPAPFRRPQPAPRREPDTLDRLIAEHDAAPFLAAPVAEPAPVTAPLNPSAVLTPAEVGRAADDSIWDRHGILREQLWQRLALEVNGNA